MTISSEWDPYTVANDRFAKRLAENGRLVENVVYPGANHAFMYELSFKLTPSFWADFKHAVATYVHKIN